MSKNVFYVEKNAQGNFAAKKAHAQRATVVEPTQTSVIKKLKEIDPNATIHVERVRNTKAGSPDKWRNP